MTDLRSSRALGAAGLDGPSGPLTALQPIVRQSVNEAVYRALRNKLMHGEYRAGQQLGIQELADALETSTMPVREALRREASAQAVKDGRTRIHRQLVEQMHVDVPAVNTFVSGQQQER